MLRPLREDDLDELQALIEANRDHLRPWMPWADNEREDTADFLRTALADERSGAAKHMAVLAGDRMAGTCGFHHVDERNRSAMLGYWLAAGHEGRGLMSAAVSETLDMMFGERGLHRAELRTNPANARSRAVAERLGFREEGVLREAERFPDGYRDMVLYAMLASDWR